MKSKKVLIVTSLFGVSAFTFSGTLTTTFTGNNSFAGNNFDLVATSGDLLVNSWDINIGATTDLVNVKVYWRTGTYVGNHLSADGWNLLGTSAITSNGQGTPSNLPLGGLLLPKNQTIGIYLFLSDYTSNSPRPAGVPAIYYNSTSLASPTYSNSDLMFSGGLGRGVVAPDPFAASVFGTPGSTTNGRIWNGNVNYTPVPEPISGFALVGGVLGMLLRKRSAR